MKQTHDKTTSYRILGKYYAQHFMTENNDDKTAVARACEEQGILAVFVYRHLLDSSATLAAEFLLAMITIVQEAEEV